MSTESPARRVRLTTFWRGNCARSTARDWIKQGKLRAYKIGRMTYVDETYDEFVARVAVEIKPAQPAADEAV